MRPRLVIRFQLVVLAACLAALSAVGAPAKAAPAAETMVDRGVLRITADGKEVGVERFEIGPSPEGVRATGELQTNLDGGGRMIETCTLVLRGGTEPVRYERVQKSPKHGSAILTFARDKATAHYKTTEGASQDMEYYVPSKVLILDTNFFHHYTFLVRQYDFITGGIQHMNVLVPQEASPGMMRVEFAGQDQGLRKLIARTDQLEIDIWANDAGQIMRVAVPAAKVEVVREK